MTLYDFIQRTHVEPPEAPVLCDAARALGLSVPDLFDAVAYEIVDGYLAGRYHRQFGDSVMTRLFGSAHLLGNHPHPAFAWQVYVALDEDGYTRPEDFDHEPYTKTKLAELARSSVQPSRKVARR